MSRQNIKIIIKSFTICFSYITLNLCVLVELPKCIGKVICVDVVDKHITHIFVNFYLHKYFETGSSEVVLVGLELSM